MLTLLFLVVFIGILWIAFKEFKRYEKISSSLDKCDEEKLRKEELEVNMETVLHMDDNDVLTEEIHKFKKKG